MTESKSLKKAVASEVKDAKKDAKTGDVETVPQSKGGPATDLPTGAHSRR
jgi:hypothetical protein